MRRQPFSHFLAVVLAALLFAGVASGQAPIRDLKPTVILIAVDGFRFDYFEKHRPPVLNQIAKEGVRAKWLVPSFPTKTFPNHYTVATGLYPQNHGIVENNIWDFGTVFGMSKREEVENSRWWLGEPIWVTAEKQGQRAAAMFFPGTEAEIAGERPTFWSPYEHEFPIDQRVDKVLGWLDLPAKQRPTVYTLYFSDIDSAGHSYGPDAAKTRDAVHKVDTAIGRLVSGLKQRKIYGKANLIFFSDHGMAPVDVRRTAILDEYFDFDLTERILWTGEIAQIFPKDGRADEIAAKLRNVKHARCWKKADIPARLNYNTGPRVAPIICSADEGAVVSSRQRLADRQKRADYGSPSGAHGYDNQFESMRAMFVAHGKAFKKGKVVEPFPNVDIYELMARILKLKPAKNDGDLSRLKGMLR
jgi:predicted AlkP superfamily pyrophosphatase or phosphodiesterase